MFCTPTKTDFTKTSTPKFSPGDSGYFGSCAEPRHKSPLFVFSPLHESPAKGKQPDLFAILKNSPSAQDSRHGESKFGFPSVIRQLNYDDSALGNESTYFKEAKNLSGIPPLYPWSPPDTKLVNKNYTALKSFFHQTARVDILNRLKKRNCEHIISNLLSFLPAEDLCQMKGVSRMWKEIIVKDVKANGRRREYLRKMRSQRENRPASRFSQFIQKRYEPRIILCDIANMISGVSPKKNYNTRFDSFLNEGQNIQNGILLKCPRCSYAAKARNENEYMCTECNFIFHKQLSQITYDHNCSLLSIPRHIIGSKQCKKNLKRLL